MLAHRDACAAVAEVEQPVARFAYVASPYRYVREERDKRRFPAVGQHDRLRIPALQRAPQTPAASKMQRAVAKRRGDYVVDFRHAARDRHDPLRGKHVELDARLLLAQAREQRLRHERVTDPVGCDNQDARQAAVSVP